MIFALQVKLLKVFTDSKLVVDQVIGLLLTKDVKMVAYKVLVLEIVKQFEELVFVNVLREENSKADQLAVETSQLRLEITRSISIEVISTPSISISNWVQTIDIQE